MHKSSRILLIYSASALIATAASCVLTYLVWEWQVIPNTLEQVIRPVALIAIPILGLSLVVQIVGDPLAWRVVRMQRRKEHPIAASSTR